MEAPPPSYQEAVNSEHSSSSSFTYPSQSSPDSNSTGAQIPELCVCPQHGVVPRLNVCICGRDGIDTGTIQAMPCQHCSNYVIVQRHLLNTHAENSTHPQVQRHDVISEGHCDQSVSNDVTVHFDSAKGTVSSLVSTGTEDSTEREPMISNANVSFPNSMQGKLKHTCFIVMQNVMHGSNKTISLISKVHSTCFINTLSFTGNGFIASCKPPFVKNSTLKSNHASQPHITYYIIRKDKGNINSVHCLCGKQGCVGPSTFPVWCCHFLLYG